MKHQTIESANRDLDALALADQLGALKISVTSH
ncbi:hypothetical protein VSF3289_00609 [Vibrio scophthalmi]|uniref:Uncharacterized protein n=1 Tax=Vibrio scophthalmi TaxID=45658 RepID=A0A1E3WKR0_9VIBR|nr:hypothetical protein VSF3289_00609 [Vibrio scophthalmi]